MPKIMIELENGYAYYRTEQELLDFQKPEDVLKMIDAEVSDETIIRWESILDAFAQYQKELKDLLRKSYSSNEI